MCSGLQSTAAVLAISAGLDSDSLRLTSDWTSHGQAPQVRCCAKIGVLQLAKHIQLAKKRKSRSQLAMVNLTIYLVPLTRFSVPLDLRPQTQRPRLFLGCAIQICFLLALRHSSVSERDTDKICYRYLVVVSMVLTLFCQPLCKLGG